MRTSYKPWKRLAPKDADTLESLYKATQWVPKYLDYDDSRALAVKAIWAIGNIPGPEADNYLQQLTGSDNPFFEKTLTSNCECDTGQDRLPAATSA